MNGTKLRTLREKKGLLQKELAMSLNTSTSTIGMYEHERREPDNKTLKKIANFFNVSIDYLLDNENINISSEIILKRKEELKNALIKNKCLNSDEKLNDEELERLIKFIKINLEFIKEKRNSKLPI